MYTLISIYKLNLNWTIRLETFILTILSSTFQKTTEPSLLRTTLLVLNRNVLVYPQRAGVLAGFHFNQAEHNASTH